MTHPLRRRRFLPYLFQSLAREVGLTVLDPKPGEKVLEVGAESGEVLLKIATLVGPEGRAVGAERDGAARALAEARLREVGYANFELVDADAASLPFPSTTFDGVYAAFAAADEPALAELRRVLKPGGRIVVCGVAPGERPVTRTVSAVWSALHRVAPPLAGRLRPRNLTPPALKVGLEIDRRLYLEQRGVPSEVLLLRRPARLAAS